MSGTQSEEFAKLRSDRVTSLYYDEQNFPVAVVELIKGNDVKAIAEAYDPQDSDDLFRFNLLLILNHLKPETWESPEKVLVAGDFLRKALQDRSAWVRTEAAWGIGRIGTKSDMEFLLPLLDDEDNNVVNETLLSLDKISGLNKDVVSAQDLTPEMREALVKMWKLKLKR
jgi:hypothetical protein